MMKFPEGNVLPKADAVNGKIYCKCQYHDSTNNDISQCYSGTHRQTGAQVPREKQGDNGN